MPPALFQATANSLFSKLKAYTLENKGGDVATGYNKNRRRSGHRFTSMSMPVSMNSSKPQELDKILFDDQSKERDEVIRHYEIPASQISWHMQKKILSRKLYQCVDPSATLTNSHLDESVIVYNKAPSMGSRLLSMIAACDKSLETVSIDSVYQVFEANSENVSPIYFDILDFIGLCLDSKKLRSRSLPINERIFSPDMPILYVTRKFEQLILRYMPMNTHLFEKIDNMLIQCEGRVTYNRKYWDAYPVISYVSQLTMYTLLDTAIRERNLEEIDSTTLYNSGVMTDNGEPLYPMVYILFRMGQYESLAFLLERYSRGVPDIVSSLCSVFWKLYQGSQCGDIEAISSEITTIKRLVNSKAYTNLMSSTASAETDLFLSDFLHFFTPYHSHALLDSLQHVSVDVINGFSCVFEFANLFHLSVSMFIYPETPAEQLCIVISDVNFQITQKNISPVRSLIAFHNILTYNFYNAIYVLAAEVDLLPEAVGLYFLLAIVCRSYHLTMNPTVDTSETKNGFVLSDESLRSFAAITDLYDMPFCEFDENLMTYFANPEHLDTTTAMGMGSILLAFILCHCAHSNYRDVLWFSRILPINSQLIFLATVISFLPFNDNLINQTYFSQEIYPLLQSGTNIDIPKNNVLMTDYITYPNRLHRLLIFLLGGAYKMKGEAAIAFEYYKTSMTHGNGLELAFECSAIVLEAGSMSSHKKLLPILEFASKLKILYQSSENMRSIPLESMFGDEMVSDNINLHNSALSVTNIPLHNLSSSMYYKYRHVWVMLSLVEAKAILEQTDNLEEVVQLCNKKSGLYNAVMCSKHINSKLAEKGTIIANFLLNTYTHCRLSGYTNLAEEFAVVRDLCRRVHVDHYVTDLAVQICREFGI